MAILVLLRRAGRLLPLRENLQPRLERDPDLAAAARVGGADILRKLVVVRRSERLFSLRRNMFGGLEIRARHGAGFGNDSGKPAVRGQLVLLRRSQGLYALRLRLHERLARGSLRAAAEHEPGREIASFEARVAGYFE